MQPSTGQKSAREEILEARRAYPHAMDEGDTEALDDMLDDGFTLTHMTGYVQPKAEWPAQMRESRFVYHSIDEKNTTLDIESDTAHLAIRTVTDATVYGTRANWLLGLPTDYARKGDTWGTVRPAATPW
ncbi:nuclear transport factor 2 family protein [Streptomyces sp. NPDC001530]|uniref:nuclear transport factor 2 family protein n=1 Tax=Streptomyces sp. NPDC001530 TaxID=3364582 RepID=UPI003675C9A8